MPNEVIIPQAVVFETDPDREHARILQAKAKTAESAHELGTRLARFRETSDWQKVTTNGPYNSFTDYIARGVGVSTSQAFVYMRAARLPSTVTSTLGIQGAATLASILESTQIEETLEDALSLEVESDDGTLKPFASLTAEERERALARVREETGIVRPGLRLQKRDNAAAVELRDRLRSLSADTLKAGQIQTRRMGGTDVIDFEAIPIEKARELFETLAAALKH